MEQLIEENNSLKGEVKELNEEKAVLIKGCNAAGEVPSEFEYMRERLGLTKDEISRITAAGFDANKSSFSNTNNNI